MLSYVCRWLMRHRTQAATRLEWNPVMVMSREALVSLSDADMALLQDLIETLGITNEKLVSMPGLGQEQVGLGGKFGFNNDVNAVLSNLSFIRNAPRYLETRGHRWTAVEPSSKTCSGCNQTFGDLFGYSAAWGERTYVADYRIVAVVPHGGKRNARRDDSAYFCFACASSAQNMRDHLTAPVWADYMRDGENSAPDVFDFIATTINEDALHGTQKWLDGCELRMLAGGNFGGGDDGGCNQIIGGRILYHLIRNAREQRLVDTILARAAKQAERAKKAAAANKAKKGKVTKAKATK